MIPFTLLLIGVVVVALVARAATRVGRAGPGELAGGDGSLDVPAPVLPVEELAGRATGSSPVSPVAGESRHDDGGGADADGEEASDSAEEDYEWRDLVTVLRTSDPALLPLAKSLLKAEGIPFVALREGLQNLLGLGLLGGFNVVTGPVELQVPREHESRARLVLSEQMQVLEVLPDPDEGVS